MNFAIENLKNAGKYTCIKERGVNYSIEGRIGYGLFWDL